MMLIIIKEETENVDDEYFNVGIFLFLLIYYKIVCA